ncbi:MAG: hypothetical protein DRJ50_06025 [Actinobacteria bacterium]|nr:MAG: hypothetical protein DRJ50_06025 [Actinomycetota bacterium]
MLVVAGEVMVVTIEVVVDTSDVVGDAESAVDAARSGSLSWTSPEAAHAVATRMTTSVPAPQNLRLRFPGRGIEHLQREVYACSGSRP